MVNAINDNMFLVNAPAGSGKTTFIKNKINEIIDTDKSCQILCITYTNRATEELLSKIDSKNVKIATIHSFISEFLKIYFSNKEIINLYFEIYKNEICDRIDNNSNDERIDALNQKYKDEHDGNLDFEYIKNNTNKIFYNELPFNSLYYGGLSHDALLSFAEIMLNKYPIIKKRLSSLYKYIFVDEYQDTSANILRFFYNSTKDSKTMFFLCGDRMQQIYKNYDGTFEENLMHFNDSNYSLRTNYRSSKNIVKMLNNIYNDPTFIQNFAEDKEDGEVPQIYITDELNATLSTIETSNPEILKLFIFNKERFEKIGALNLFEAVSNMDKYSFGKKYGAVDVLLNNNDDNPDSLFKLLFDINDFIKKFQLKQYGLLVQKINTKNNHIYNKNILKINKNRDKKIFKDLIESLIIKYNENITIKDFLITLKDKKIVTDGLIDNYLENEDENEYSEILNQNIDEFKNICKYTENPYISTQHGVKGEGHNAVVFIAENSNNPSVKMYKFFELISKNEIRYNEFENFYYNYLNDVKNFEEKNNLKISEIKKDIYIANETFLNNFIKTINQKYEDNIYYQFFFSDYFSTYCSKSNVTNFKNTINTNSVFGTLIAYKLFYVGCSRAKNILKIIVDKNEIISFYDDFKDKMVECGFEIIEWLTETNRF